MRRPPIRAKFANDYVSDPVALLQEQMNQQEAKLDKQEAKIEPLRTEMNAPLANILAELRAKSTWYAVRIGHVQL